MSDTNTLEVVIRGRDEFGRTFQQLERTINGLEGEARSATGTMQRGMQGAHRETNALSSAVSDLGRQILSTATGFLVRDVIIGSWNKLRAAIRGNADELINVNRQWELYEAQFYVQLGRSHDAAVQRLREIEDFAVRTPFNLDEIIEADLLMQTFGIHSQDAARRWGMAGEDIRTVAGDVAAGTVAGFKEISLWLGRFAVGDTGQAMRRFQELGVVTRQELRQMGIEFDKAGALVTPVDQAMTALLQVMQRKFGGLMEIEADTLRGMESNLQDWMQQQRRIWGEPVFELYKEGLRGLMGFLNSEGVQEMATIARGLFTSGVEWLGDLLRVWTGGFAELIARAADWGANIVEALAGGIEGSGAIVRALNSVSRTMTYWLQPGSPPRLLPDLTRWGAGAAEAWLEGWGVSSPTAGRLLEDMRRSLQPWLEGAAFDSAAFRETFGARAQELEPWVRAQRDLAEALDETESARLALAEAEEDGDEEAIEAARERLLLAETGEGRARERAEREQRQIVDKARAEAQLLDAMREQTAAVAERERMEMSAAANAEARAEEAEARAIRQAELQYRLAVAGTAAAQIPIWEDQLRQAEEGSAEWWQIRTRLVELQRQAERDAAAAAKALGGGVGDALAEGLRTGVGAGVEGMGDDLDGSVERIDWAGIWGAVGATVREALMGEIRKIPGALLELDMRFTEWLTDQLVNQLEGISVDLLGMTLDEGRIWLDGMLAWASAGGGSVAAEEIGRNIGSWIAWGVQELFRDRGTSDEIGDEVIESLRRSVMDISGRLIDIGDGIVRGIIRGVMENMGWRMNDALDQVLRMGFTERVLRTFGLQDNRAVSRFAGGTSFAPGGLALVGEQGPELVHLPRGSEVYTATETRGLTGGGSTVNIAPGAIQIHIGRGDAREVEIGVLRALRQVGVPA
jgi:hypothetical protein